jgi:glycosyltransferase involved in cell wall biosynthesis
VRHLLVVSYYHPPAPGIGGSRWAAMARHLRAQGYSVTVVASGAWGELPDDADQGVVRTTDLRSLGALRGLLRRGELPLAGGSGLERPPNALLTKVFVPDAHVVSWVAAALVVVRRLLARQKFDCLVTSSPPESAHLLGLLLGRRRPPWIADFRDGWSLEPLRERFPTAAQRALDTSLERRVARTAELCVGATRPIALDLEQRLGVRAVHVTNAWDPYTEAALGTATPPVRSDDDGVRLVLTGTFSGVRGSTPEPLLEALASLARGREVSPLHLLVAGRLTADERQLIDRTALAGTVRHLGLLDHASSLALQRSADALVLLTSRHVSEATGKLFEYLAAGRPILALADGNEAARIVQETRTGVTVPPDDVDAIAAALRAVVSGELARAYEPHGLEAYTYPAPAEAMAALVEEAIRRAGRL